MSIDNRRIHIALATSSNIVEIQKQTQAISHEIMHYISNIKQILVERQEQTQAISHEIMYYLSNIYQILVERQEQTQAISYDSPRGGVSQITEKGETTASFLLIQVAFL